MEESQAQEGCAMVFVGIDLRKTYSYVGVMAQAGKMLDERRLRNQAVATI